MPKIIAQNLSQKFRSKSCWDIPNFLLVQKFLSELDSSQCNQIANQLSKCKESYLIKIGYNSGGSIGWLGGDYIFVIFETLFDEFSHRSRQHA